MTEPCGVLFDLTAHWWCAARRPVSREEIHERLQGVPAAQSVDVDYACRSRRLTM